MTRPELRTPVLFAVVGALLGGPACTRAGGPEVRSATSSSASPATSPAPAASGSPSAHAERPIPTEVPVAAERNPPGDIPDSTQFVLYASPTGGYSLKVPEGWARSEQGTSVAFADKLDAVRVDVRTAPATPTLETVKAEEGALSSSVRAFKEVKVQTVALPAGPAVLLRYQANSDPDPVTGRQVRQEVDRYEVYKDGKLAVISLTAPAGVDNVDVWNLVSHSFRWTS